MTTDPARPDSGRAMLEPTSQNERAFLLGKRDRSDEVESAVRIFLEFLRGFLDAHPRFQKPE